MSNKTKPSVTAIIKGLRELAVSRACPEEQADLLTHACAYLEDFVRLVSVVESNARSVSLFIGGMAPIITAEEQQKEEDERAEARQRSDKLREERALRRTDDRRYPHTG